MKKPIGLYIHVPFCRGKCPYCDFYSVNLTDGICEQYINKVCSALDEKCGAFDTVYFGGGTPSLLGAGGIVKILSHVSATDGCEVTVECNPSDTADGSFDFSLAAQAGVNRISLGLQSAVDSERKALGRRAGAADVESAVRLARQAGIDNISLDLMLGIPGQTQQSLQASVDFCAQLGASHISAYMLKIEPGTAFYGMQDSLDLPGEDAVCDLYLYCIDRLARHGYNQYEISNFALPGFESRHNLKYWRCEEYLGIGPAAHSFIDGRRYYYDRSLENFLNGCPPVQDGDGGSFEEYAMLALRLREGLIFEKARERFGSFPLDIIKKAQAPRLEGLVNITDKNISLTAKGFLLSNAVTGELIL